MVLEYAIAKVTFLSCGQFAGPTQVVLASGTARGQSNPLSINRYDSKFCGICFCDDLQFKEINQTELNSYLFVFSWILLTIIRK